MLHLGCNRALVSLAGDRRRRLGRAVLLPIAHGFPVLGIVVPGPTLWLSIVAHEDAEFLPGLAVVGFHEESFFAFGKTKKLLARCYELAGRGGLNCEPACCDGIHDLLLRPVVWLHDKQRLWAVARQVVFQGIFETRCIAHFSVIHLPAVFAELRGELAHGGELKDALDFMGPPRVPRLYQQNDILAAAARFQGRIVKGELVAKNQNRIFHDFRQLSTTQSE